MRKTLYRRVGTVLFPLLLPVMRPILRRTRRVYVVLQYRDEVLLVKNWLARDTWRLPGGGVAHGEDSRSAAIREIWEELGIRLDIESLHYLTKGFLTSDNLGFEYEVYCCRLTQTPIISPNKLEIVDYDFFAEVPDGMYEDFARVALGRLLKK